MVLSPFQTIPSELADYSELFVRAGKFVLAFVAVYLAGRLAVEPAVDEVVRRRNRNNPTIQDAVGRYLNLLVVLVALAVAIAAAGYSQVLARSALVVAAATLAIGVAGQAVIGNLVSGLFLVSDRNFNVGDWIAWGDREGVVEAISLRTTRVRTPDNETVTVPNTDLATTAITRPYGRDRYRVSERIGIGYDDDVEAAMEVLDEIARGHDSILDDPAPRTYLEGFEDAAATVQVFYWLRSPSRQHVMRVRSEFELAVVSRFREEEIDLTTVSNHEIAGSLAIEPPDDPW
jgi:small-conductance mechanosensitive channel